MLGDALVSGMTHGEQTRQQEIAHDGKRAVLNERLHGKIGQDLVLADEE